MKFDPTGIASTEAKIHFGEILNKCVYGGGPVVIKRHDKPVAVLVSFDDWKQKTDEQSQEEPALIKEIRAIRESIAQYQRKNKIKPGKSAVELVRELRDESLK